MRAMPPYPVNCCGANCQSPASFKIAAQWTDGITRELKTYFLSCQECLNTLLIQAGEKQRVCRLAPAEKLEPPGIYDLSRGAPDRNLVRRSELE